MPGLWERTNRETDDALRDEAIGRVAASVTFVARAVARAVMTYAMAPPERYTIRLANSGLAIRADEDDEELTSWGDAGSTSRRVEGGFEQTWQHGENSHGTTLWRLSPDGTRLTVTARVRDANFDGELEYSTSYRRVQASRGDAR